MNDADAMLPVYKRDRDTDGSHRMKGPIGAQCRSNIVSAAGVGGSPRRRRDSLHGKINWVKCPGQQKRQLRAERGEGAAQLVLEQCALNWKNEVTHPRGGWPAFLEETIHTHADR